MQHSRSGRAERKQGDKTGGHAKKRSEQELGKADPQRTGHQIDERERHDRNHPNKRYSQHSVADELLSNTPKTLAEDSVHRILVELPADREHQRGTRQDSTDSRNQTSPRIEGCRRNYHKENNRESHQPPDHENSYDEQHRTPSAPFAEKAVHRFSRGGLSQGREYP